VKTGIYLGDPAGIVKPIALTDGECA